MKTEAALLTIVLLSTCIGVVTSTPVYDGSTIPDPSTDSTNHLSHLNLNDVMDMVTNFRSVFTLLKLFMRISPPLRDVIAQTSKENAEFRVLFKLLDGNSFSLSDIVDLVTKKQQNMWSTFATVSDQNPTLEKILKLMEDDNPDVKTIIKLLTGQNPKAKQSEFKDDKYTVTSNALVQNQNFLDLGNFIIDNWLNLNANVFSRMFTSPIDYTSILKDIVGLDFNHYPLHRNSLLVPMGGKMAVSNPAGGDVTVDAKLAKILQDVLVLGPQILKGKDPESKARDDVLDIFHNFIEASTMMIETPSQDVNES